MTILTCGTEFTSATWATLGVICMVVALLCLLALHHRQGRR